MEPCTPPDMERYECVTPFAFPDVPEVKQIIARESEADCGKLTIEGLDALDALEALEALDSIDSKASREIIFSTCGRGWAFSSSHKSSSVKRALASEKSTRRAISSGMRVCMTVTETPCILAIAR